MASLIPFRRLIVGVWSWNLACFLCTRMSNFAITIRFSLLSAFIKRTIVYKQSPLKNLSFSIFKLYILYAQVNNKDPAHCKFNLNPVERYYIWRHCLCSIFCRWKHILHTQVNLSETCLLLWWQLLSCECSLQIWLRNSQWKCAFYVFLMTS